MEDYNDSYVVTGESVKELNSQISSMEAEGYVCAGNHTVVILESRHRQENKVTRNTVEYAQRMSRTVKPKGATM